MCQTSFKSSSRSSVKQDLSQRVKRLENDLAAKVRLIKDLQAGLPTAYEVYFVA